MAVCKNGRMIRVASAKKGGTLGPMLSSLGMRAQEPPTVRRGGVSLVQPGACDHRGVSRRLQGLDLHVQATDPGAAVPDALLGVLTVPLNAAALANQQPWPRRVGTPHYAGSQQRCVIDTVPRIAAEST